jgi:hypothetical protein
MLALHNSVDVEKLPVMPMLLSVVLKSLCDLLSVCLPLILWKYASPKKQRCPKGKVKLNLLN